MDLAGTQLGDVLDAVAAREPAPGGGAVASILAALSAALAEMVVQYSMGKKSLAEHAALYERAIAALKELRARSLRLAADDAVAYERLNALQKLDRDDPTRQAGWEDAVNGAIAVPKACLELGLDLLRLCEELAGRTNTWLRSDLAIAAVSAEAAAAGAAWNVRINLPLLQNESSREALEAEIHETTAEASRIRELIEDTCR